MVGNRPVRRLIIGIAGLLVICLSACSDEIKHKFSDKTGAPELDSTLTLDPVLGTLETDRIELMLDSQEPIVEVLVREGQRVSVGDVLVKQDAARVDAQLQQAQAQVDTAKAQLQQAVNGQRPQEISQARARLEASESLERVQQGEWQRSQSLAASSFSAAQDVDILKGRYDATSANSRQARFALELLVAGSRQEVIAMLQSQLVVSPSRLSDIQISQQRLSLILPLSGIVTRSLLSSANDHHQAKSLWCCSMPGEPTPAFTCQHPCVRCCDLALRLESRLMELSRRSSVASAGLLRTRVLRGFML